MKGQVTLSKKEQRLRQSAQARQTYDQQKAASRGRHTSVKDFTEVTRVLKGTSLPDVETLHKLIDGLIGAYREGSGDPAHQDLRIFDPQLTDLSNLPIGLLDHKELPLPNTLIPQNRADLLALCERMIVRSRDRELVAYVVAGWPGCSASRLDIHGGKQAVIDEAHSYLARHVDCLWQLWTSAPALYAAIVTGRHYTALKLLRAKGPPRSFSVRSILDMVIKQGLIWCCHDIQLILARGRAAAANPLGALISTSHVELKPEGIANSLKPHLLLLRTLLATYVTIDEETHPLFPRPMPQDIPDDEDGRARRLAAAVSHELAGLVVRLGDDRNPLDQLIEYMREMHGCANDRVRELLEQPVTANELEAHFSGLWFSSLSHVQVAAITMLRYLQAECWIERLTHERYPAKGAPRSAPRDSTAMPPFVADELPRGWRSRVKDLLYLYRREALRDKMAPFPDVPLTRRKSNAGDKVLDVALQFLHARSQRRIGDDAGHIESVERTFYLIDLIPEARLAR